MTRLRITGRPPISLHCLRPQVMVLQCRRIVYPIRSGRDPVLRNSKDLEGSAISATDGAIGDVQDLYFDDEEWVIRYLVVSTGAWLANRKVLISPVALRQRQWSQKSLGASLTQEQVKNSPT